MARKENMVNQGSEESLDLMESKGRWVSQVFPDSQDHLALWDLGLRSGTLCTSKQQELRTRRARQDLRDQPGSLGLGENLAHKETLAYLELLEQRVAMAAKPHDHLTHYHPHSPAQPWVLGLGTASNSPRWLANHPPGATDRVEGVPLVCLGLLEKMDLREMVVCQVHMGSLAHRGLMESLEFQGCLYRGAVGEPGVRAADGGKGADGHQGKEGIRGFPGQDGSLGQPGVPGYPGKPLMSLSGGCQCEGVSGPPGTQGPPGLEGGRGAPGHPGQSGPRGYSGLAGHQGPHGSKGSMVTGSMVTGSMVTGSMVTGSMVTGSMVTGSMVTGSMVTGSMAMKKSEEEDVVMIGVQGPRGQEGEGSQGPPGEPGKPGGHGVPGKRGPPGSQGVCDMASCYQAYGRLQEEHYGKGPYY
ncbi:hypothetical protein NHX12_003691 [Muraenolepis orangiensis]|uniref:Uncharacterized protein n=1 Tax=Muraenolepis orangiensis TaxID=630683 RepID=A0A9Q0ID58_9TELE|nr:hypothetical protein NHX12_003691 [Muraenolepis orangiensis]